MINVYMYTIVKKKNFKLQGLFYDPLMIFSLKHIKRHREVNQLIYTINLKGSVSGVLAQS